MQFVRKWYQQMNVCGLDQEQAKQYWFRLGHTILMKVRPYNKDLDQALQYWLRLGPAIWIKIRPYNSD